MKKGILILMLLFGLAFQCDVMANELTSDYLDIATNFYNTNNLDKAIEYLDLILYVEPENVDAKALRDKISPPQADTVKVIEETVRVLNGAHNPQAVSIIEAPKVNVENIVYDSEYYNTRGQEFYQQKDFSKAIEYFGKSVAVNNKNAQAYNNLAMAYWCANNPEAAIKYFKKANSVNKNYTQPLVNLSNLYKKMGDRTKQLDYLKKAIKINSCDYTAYYWLGDYYRSRGNYFQAISNFKEAIKINPKFSRAYLSLAMCFFETENFNYSIMTLNQYMEFYPDSDFAYYLMAKSSLAMCSFDNAKKYIQRAIAISNNNKEYQFELAKIDFALGDYKVAIEVLQKYLQDSNSAEAFNYVGLCNYKLKNVELAEINFRKAIERDGLRSIYYYNLAQCYKSVGDKRNYVKYVNTATSITPVNYQDFIDLSYIYFDNGNPSYAINSLNDAIKKYPCVKSLYLAKLKIYETIGDNLHYNETKNLIEMEFNKNEKAFKENEK